ncbi:bifunctional 3'-5' exonuclease/DNA polymerase [Streptomyces profundus]|uniref:bifunctional 3'-5' exonuclease/DNA polymerase n=1 Tax=Streptomyces profundus TaxID=2867410 RepID=UPI001D16C84F|nr:bifunctional 3'-5' exonuclease/DNA polymerase [Streptomyces sp. MA3_2.13]UED82912.1 bifunctional 3'-5' exonuclease/DNA polymerase [Streptomyces sp. MA3_2.13]
MNEERVAHCALAEYPDGSVRVVPLDAAGRRAGGEQAAPGAAEAVRARPWVTRWVWRSTASVYPAVLAAGGRVERCHDVEAAEALLLAYEGAWGRPRSLAAALARLTRQPEPADPPPAAPTDQPSLFDASPAPLPGDADPLAALLAVYAAQRERIALTERPDRMRLLLAAESAGTLVAAELRVAGLPWRADIHRRLLDELLGERYPGGAEPRRLAELSEEISAAFGGARVRPDLPAEVVRAFGRAGVRVESTRAWELRRIDHPAVAPLLEYKRLYRIWTAHGWSWLRTWVRDGRFRTEYVVGGTMSGRWTTHGGGALQIPRVVRRAVVADPGWRLVVADAAQLEPRVLAAISGDRGLMAVAASPDDLYTRLARQGFSGEREAAKLSLLGAMYGQTSGDGLRHLADLRRRFPLAVACVDEAALAGERGELVRTWLGRTCPVEDEDGTARSGAAARARGRFTRNFVVQGSAAEWALLMLAALRGSLRELRAELVFFQHDEVLVHCPEEEVAAVTAAITAASSAAARLAFGDTPVVFPFTTAAVETYAEAK